MKIPKRIAQATFAILTGALLGFSHNMARAALMEDLVWSNGDVRLGGTLYLPEGKGPHPAFIYLHGSGPDTRKGLTYQRYARQFADNGVAMLLYDKRGTGESTGDWMQSDYSDLANDAVAGIELLVKRDDIDKNAIGIVGGSEGGWTGPLAATRSSQVSLLILISAPPMSPYEQGLYEYSVELRNEKLPEDQIAEVIALARLREQVRQSDTGWEELDRAIEAARVRPWYEAAGSPERPEKNPANPRTQWYRRIMHYDPMPVLHTLRVPTLLLYGADDPLVDAKRSAEIMQSLRDNEGKDFTIHVYPGCGHNLTTNGFKFPDDHWDRIFDWITAKRTAGAN